MTLCAQEPITAEAKIRLSTFYLLLLDCKLQSKANQSISELYITLDFESNNSAIDAKHLSGSWFEAHKLNRLLFSLTQPQKL